MSCGGALGSGGVGSTPVGSGSLLFVLSARQESLNAVIVTFAVPPEAFDPATFWDALRVRNWSLTPIDPPTAARRLVQYVERGPTSFDVRVFLDGPLDAPATYQITVSGDVRSATGGAGAPSVECRSALFVTFPPTRYPFGTGSPDLPSDLDNPQTVSDAGQNAPIGTYQITEQGDLGIVSGRRYLRKRILRRVLTVIGGFFHLPTYGAAEPLKGRLSTTVMLRVQARLQAQIALEPDVVAVSVEVSQLLGNQPVMVIEIRARDRSGPLDPISVPVPIPS